jgi:hypothetical protein
MREVNIMNTISISSYIKGAKNAKLTMDNCIKDGILFSAELIVLSILLLIYSGVASYLTIIMMSAAIILLVSTIISRSIFMKKVNVFFESHPDDKSYATNEDYIDDSMSVLKIGTYTAVINIITTVISVLTVLILIVGLLT